MDSKTATEQYIKRQKRIAHEQGHGELDIPRSLEREVQTAAEQVLAGEPAEVVLERFPNEQKQLVEEIVALVEEQKSSLDQWVDYLASPDAPYPDWFKYWAMRNVLNLSKYDKDKKVFPKREPNTINPFPDLQHDALAFVLDVVNKKAEGQKIDLDQLGEDDRQQIEKLLASENFAKLYAWVIEKITPASVEALAITAGHWVKYKQGSKAMKLVESIQGYGTGWCTAGEAVAQSQLSRGDFYVYYSLDEDKKPTIPRAAIRMEGKNIAEVRGIAKEQNLDAYIAPVVQQKMKEFPDGTAYEKKAGDMKKVTTIENKVKLGQELSKVDLIFLYEIESAIEGFGYQRDPRIAELRKERDPKKDAPIVFECKPHEIAWNQQEITNNTKAYVGPLFKGIFEQLGHLEHLSTSFPEGKVRRDAVEIESKTSQEYLVELKKQGFQVSDYAKYMVEHMRQQAEEAASKSVMAKLKDTFGKKEIRQQREQVDLVRLTVRDLGFTQGATTDQIYAKAEEFGLELCPPEVGPEYRLQYKNQPMGEWFVIAMKQISDPDGNPHVFKLGHDEGGVWLLNYWAEPDEQWRPEDEFLFRLSSLRNYILFRA